MPLTQVQMKVVAKLSAAASTVKSNCAGTAMKWSIACLYNPNNEADVKMGSGFASGLSSFQAPSWVYNVNGLNPKSTNDSEVKALVNLITYYNSALNGGGYNVAMYSSDGPCKSCKPVIKTFLNYYHKSGLIVYCKEHYTAEVGGVWDTAIMYGYGDEQKEGELYYKII